MGTLLQVELAFMPLSDILQWIEMNRLSCVVAITVPGGNGLTIYLEYGAITSVVSPRSGHGLGEYLIMSGVLSESQVLQALADCRVQDIPFTRYIVERGMVSPVILNEQCARLAEKLLVDILGCTSGSVTITSTEPEAHHGTMIHLSTGQVLFNAVRMLDEAQRDSRERDSAIEAINRRLYQEEFQLPVLPTMVMQLIALMEDERASFQDMARLIMTDQVLISNVLKVANSSYYAGSGKVDSIHYAIVLLGMQQIMNIVTAIKINSMTSRDIPREQLQLILDNALKTAFMGSFLAQHCRQDPEEAFLGGLLLDLGKTVILSVAKDFRIDQSLLDDLLTTRHTEIGVLIARKWNYPESIQDLIRYHHTPNLGGLIRPMVALIQIADHVVSTGSEKGVDPQLMALLGLDHETILETHSQAVETFNQIKGL